MNENGSNFANTAQIGSRQMKFKFTENVEDASSQNGFLEASEDDINRAPQMLVLVIMGLVSGVLGTFVALLFGGGVWLSVTVFSVCSIVAILIGCIFISTEIRQHEQE